MVNGVVLQLRVLQTPDIGFADMIPAVVSALAYCFAIACSFVGALPPLIVLGLIAGSGPHQLITSDDSTGSSAGGANSNECPVPTLDGVNTDTSSVQEGDSNKEPLLQTNMNTFPANAHLLLQLMNPFDASIHSTASRMVENKTNMFTTPVQFLPQLVLLIINMAVLLIWVALYPLGILLVFSTVLWRPLEAQCECFRAKFKDPQLTLLCCNAPHRSYPVSCIVLPLFFLGFLLASPWCLVQVSTAGAQK